MIDPPSTLDLTTMPPLDAHARPQAALALLFALWKAFLLSVTQGTRLFSSTPDYDTSTSLFLTRQYGPAAPSPASPGHVLTRWDALYFVSAVRDGKLFEQEWAFGHAFSLVVRAFSGSTGAGGSAGGNGWEPAAAVAVANAAHLLGVLALYRLTLSVSRSGRLALAAAALHVVSPAGVFLAAPYAESSYALLAILGNWAFVAAGGRPPLHRTVLLSVSGVLFGLATLFRSNGLGSGVLFAAEAIRCLLALCRSPRPSRVFALVGPVLGGICVGIGAAAPQVVAWQRYCDIAEPRPWCGGAIPSIYSFVQEHYW